jgi:hypothetical protein
MNSISPELIIVKNELEKIKVFNKELAEYLGYKTYKPMSEMKKKDPVRFRLLVNGYKIEKLLGEENARV